MIRNYWKQSIEILPLRTKELKALRLLKVKTFGDLKNIKIKNVMLLEGYCKGTYLKLKEIQDSVSNLKVFSNLNDGKELEYVVTDGSKLISNFTRRILKHLGVDTNEALLSLTDQEIRDCHGAGKGVLEEITNLKKSLIRESNFRQVVSSNDDLAFDTVVKDLSHRAQRALKTLEVNSFEKLFDLSEFHIINIPTLGIGTWNEINDLQQIYSFLNTNKTQSSIKYPSSDPQHALKSFSELMKKIDARTKRALDFLAVNNFTSLVDITKEDILNIPTFGTQTWNKINKLQNKYGHLCYPEAISSFQEPAKNKSIKLLPFFLNDEIYVADIELHPSFMPTVKIESLPLPQRMKPYVTMLPVETLGELLLLQKKDIMEIQGFGYSKLEDLRSIVYKFLLINSNNDYYKHEATRENLQKFPFYNGISQPKIVQGMIDSSYHPDQLLDAIDLPPRAITAFRNLKISTIGELLLITPESITHQRNFSDVSINATKQKINKYIFEKSPPIEIFSGSQSLADVFYNFIENLLPKKSCDIIFRRFGLFDANTQTLFAVAQEFNLTKERIRQILNDAKDRLKLPNNLALFEEIGAVVKDIISGAGGKISVDELSIRLNEYYDWEISTDPSLVLFSCNLFDDINVDKNTVYLQNFPCESCGLPKKVIQKLMSEIPEIEISKISTVLSLQCTKSKCNLIDSQRMSFSFEFLKGCVATDITNEEIYISENKTFCSEEFGVIKYGGKQKAVECILKLAGKPLHFTEVTSMLKRYWPDENVSNLSVHNLLFNAEKSVLWDRGTFIHLDLVMFDDKFTKKISSWIRKKLKVLDFMSIIGVYKHYKNQCRELGIISPVALFSYLKLQQPKKIYFQKYSFLTSTDQKFNFHRTIERLVLDSGGKISIKELDAFLKKHEYTLSRSSVIDRNPNLFLADNRVVIHIDILNFDIKEFHEICEYPKSLLSKKETLHVEKVFNDKAKECKKLGITGPKLLFSLFSKLGTKYVKTGSGYKLKCLK